MKPDQVSGLVWPEYKIQVSGRVQVWPDYKIQVPGRVKVEPEIQNQVQVKTDSCFFLVISGWADLFRALKINAYTFSIILVCIVCN